MGGAKGCASMACLFLCFFLCFSFVYSTPPRDPLSAAKPASTPHSYYHLGFVTAPHCAPANSRGVRQETPRGRVVKEKQRLRAVEWDSKAPTEAASETSLTPETRADCVDEAVEPAPPVSLKGRKVRRGTRAGRRVQERRRLRTERLELGTQYEATLFDPEALDAVVAKVEAVASVSGTTEAAVLLCCRHPHQRNTAKCGGELEVAAWSRSLCVCAPSLARSYYSRDT
ncbi:hypothetical protein K438DRAFT_1784513 [Mycena galopus ATCC 62051]|nr:hypothetical protein K438DRAFT_1784513 [Mycena galopus ATCC 62051]